MTVILSITLFFNTAAILFLGHLISFHLYLKSKKMTTFEYIQWKENRQQHKSKIFREVGVSSEPLASSPINENAVTLS